MWTPLIGVAPSISIQTSGVAIRISVGVAFGAFASVVSGLVVLVDSRVVVGDDVRLCEGSTGCESVMDIVGLPDSVISSAVDEV